MPTYVVLFNWTEQGIRNVRDTVERVGRVEEALGEKYGLRFEQIYWTVGPYDNIGIFEAPDDEAASAFLLEVGSAGNVRSTTLRAYNREEMSKVIERLGPSATA